jgi:hypothetical protein
MLNAANQLFEASPSRRCHSASQRNSRLWLGLIFDRWAYLMSATMQPINQDSKKLGLTIPDDHERANF